MACIIQMTEKCYGSQSPSQPTPNETPSQQTQKNQTPSQQTQNEKPSILVSWIKCGSSLDVRRSWEHVLAATTETDKTAVRTSYEEAVKSVEGKAREIYKADPFNQIPKKGDEFVRIMIEQGCFTLLVALRSLPGSKNLGLNWTKPQIKTWVLDLFSIRNQLPLIVLKKLMEENFFQNVVKSGKWRRPNDLTRMVLYDHLVEPFLKGSGSQPNMMKRLLRVVSSRGLSHQEPPPTLLHALWVLLTGPASGGAHDKRFFSWVSCRCLSLQEPSTPALLTGPASGVAHENSSNVDDDGDDDDDDNNSAWSTVRSATELQKQKIIFKSNKEMGTRGIKFKENMFDSAHLYLPSITIEADTEKLFKHLIDYEEEIGLNRNQREVCAYLKLMSELVRTADDAKILAMQGIINAQPLQEENLHKMLQKLPIPEVLGNDQNLKDVRQKIRSYVKPSKWGKLINLIVVTLFVTLLSLVVTVLQTVYTVLSYKQSGSGSNKKN